MMGPREAVAESMARRRQPRPRSSPARRGGPAVDQAPPPADRELQIGGEVLERAADLAALRRQRHGQDAALVRHRRADQLDAAAAQPPRAVPHVGADAVDQARRAA